MRTLRDVLDACATTMEFVNFGGNITPATRGATGDTPLHVVCSWGDLDAAHLLLDAGAEVNAIGDIGRTPLFCALASQNVDLVRALIAAGADLAHKDEFGDRAWDVAQAVGKQLAILELLEPRVN